jgi:hypothetical protein
VILTHLTRLERATKKIGAKRCVVHFARRQLTRCIGQFGASALSVAASIATSWQKSTQSAEDASGEEDGRKYNEENKSVGVPFIRVGYVGVSWLNFEK